jgi:integrase
MTTLAVSGDASSLISRHTSPAAYRAFVNQHIANAKMRYYHLTCYRQFVARYPELQTWCELPLSQRIGWLPGENRLAPTCRASYRARPYLLHLVTQGLLRLDWDWLIAIAQLRYQPWLKLAGVDLGMTSLLDTAQALGYKLAVVRQQLTWVVPRLYLHSGTADNQQITEADIADGIDAIFRFAERSDITSFFPSVDYYDTHIRGEHTASFHALQVVLYHRGQIPTPPRMIRSPVPAAPILKPRMHAIVERYVAQRSLVSAPHTIELIRHALKHLVQWLAEQHPTIETFAEVTREHLLAFGERMETLVGMRTHRRWTQRSRISVLSRISVFFAEVAAWEWEDVPLRPLLLHGDLPKFPIRIPRYIPDEELNRLMGAIRALPCPSQRTALLVARWSGARRDEIRRLAVDCLDSYPDGTARLRLPAGKTKQERLVPLNEEAAEAIRELQRARPTVDQGLPDRVTGERTHYLFMHRGKLRSLEYLFLYPLQTACAEVGLVDAEGKARITAHRFRHTVGKQLAEKGAKLHRLCRYWGTAAWRWRWCMHILAIWRC